MSASGRRPRSLEHPPASGGLSGQQRRVQALRLHADQCNRDVLLARRRLQVRRHRFLGNPVNLLLPFTAGALSAGLLRRRRQSRRRHDRDASSRGFGGLSLSELVTLGSSLWAAYQRQRLAEDETTRSEPSPPS